MTAVEDGDLERSAGRVVVADAAERRAVVVELGVGDGVAVDVDVGAVVV